MDIIFIRELRIETTIGVHPWERYIRQTLILDLELGADIRPAAATDCLDDTLNYQAVAQRVGEFTAEMCIRDRPMPRRRIAILRCGWRTHNGRPDSVTRRWRRCASG